MFVAAVGTGGEVIFAPESNLPVILPISGMRWKSITVGTPCMGVVSGFTFFGVGSRGEAADVYVKRLARNCSNAHFAELGRLITIVDLGCGDFGRGPVGTDGAVVSAGASALPMPNPARM